MFTYRKETTDVDVDVQCFAFKVGNVVETVVGAADDEYFVCFSE